MLGQSKKGMQSMGWGVVLGAVVLFLAGGLILGVNTLLAKEVEKSQTEKLCRMSNEIRFGAKEGNPLNFPVGPQVCKSIHIDEGIPSDDYVQTEEGAKQEIRDLMVKCWWMWLEGTQIDMLDKGVLSKQPCFSCYTFTLNEGIGPFSVTELEKSLVVPYEAKDTSENCAPNGGGYCEGRCYDFFYPKEVSSRKCPKKDKKEEVCCVAKEPRDECINKGGRCKPSCDSNKWDEKKEYAVQYNKWTCSKYSDKCCIKSGTYETYWDYFQADANGKILFQENMQFRAQDKMYTIAFLSPGRECGITNIKCWGGFIGSIAAGLGTSLFISPLGGATVAGGGMALSLIKGGEIADINYLLVSEYEGIEDKCVLEFGDD